MPILLFPIALSFYLFMLLPFVSGMGQLFHALIGQWIPFWLPLFLAYDIFKLTHKRIGKVRAIVFSVLCPTVLSLSIAYVYSRPTYEPMASLTLNNLVLVEKTTEEVYASKFSFLPAGGNEGCGCMYFEPSLWSSNSTLFSSLRMKIVQKQESIYQVSYLEPIENTELIKKIKNKEKVRYIEVEPNAGAGNPAGSLKLADKAYHFIIKEKEGDNLKFSIYKDLQLITSIKTPLRSNQYFGGRDISENWGTNIFRKIITENSLIQLGDYLQFPEFIFKDTQHPLMRLNYE